MLATNQSCLLVRTLLHFAGFHRQPLLGLLRGLLYLEVCESRSASSIELKIITFGKWLLPFVFNLASFFSKNRKSFLCPALSVPKSHSISGHRPRIPSQKFNTYDFVASTQVFVAKAGIACEHWCPYIQRRCASC